MKICTLVMTEDNINDLIKIVNFADCHKDYNFAVSDKQLDRLKTFLKNVTFTKIP